MVPGIPLGCPKKFTKFSNYSTKIVHGFPTSSIRGFHQDVSRYSTKVLGGTPSRWSKKCPPVVSQDSTTMDLPIRRFPRTWINRFLSEQVFRTIFLGILPRQLEDDSRDSAKIVRGTRLKWFKGFHQDMSWNSPRSFGDVAMMIPGIPLRCPVGFYQDGGIFSYSVSITNAHVLLSVLLVLIIGL